MPKALVFGFIALTAMCSTASGQKKTLPPPSIPDSQVDQVPEVTSRALPAVVLVVALDKSGQELGQGSGFLVTHDGRVVTNYHVVEKASSAIIKFLNGAFYQIEGVLALDPDNDIAVLKASGKDFPALPLGSYATLRVGEQVIAIGSPLALEGTVSNGIVSAVREIRNGKVRVIQTTAPISPGSSGGALLNLKGEVVGVTAYHLLPGENINFAIAADYIKPLLASSGVEPFHPKQEAADENPEPQNKQAEEPPEIPKDWVGVQDERPATVRLDGDYLYLKGTITGDGSYVQDMGFTCDTKRQGQSWAGKCHFTLTFFWSPR